VVSGWPAELTCILTGSDAWQPAVSSMMTDVSACVILRAKSASATVLASRLLALTIVCLVGVRSMFTLIWRLVALLR